MTTVDAPTRPVSPAVVTRIARATDADLQALVKLENSAFRGDRISPRSWRRLLQSRSAWVSTARDGADDGADRSALLGAAVVLRRARTSVARLYSLAVAPTARGRGVAGGLLEDAIRHTRDSGAAVLRLETRVNNHVAQRLFKRHGFSAFGRKSIYYADGTDAFLMQRPLWDSGRATHDRASAVPFHAQSLDFTCGPCALLMAMAALDPRIVLDRTAEIRIWREATTVFMAAGHGGCGPFGLALAAVRRGFGVTVYAPSGKPMFVDSVRDPRKKDVIALVEADFRTQLATTGARTVHATVSPQRLIEHLQEGSLPIVLISLWRLHGEKGPHWVVVTGFDGHVFRILDPIAAAADGTDPGISVSVDELKRITRYGRRRQAAAVVISKGS